MDPNQVLQGLEPFAEVKRAVVVTAHADDMETIMGATAWLLARRGVEFYELICTMGDIGSHDDTVTREQLAATRRDEAEQGGRILGFKQVITLGGHDGELEPSLELRAQVASYYRKWQPDTLFTFDPMWAGQVHADHRAAGRAAVDALMPSKMRLYHPEQLNVPRVADIKRAFLFSPNEASVFVDVTSVYDKKIEACVAHKSQFPSGEENLKWMRDLDTEAARRAGLSEGSYAEQFCPLRLW